MIRGRDTEEGKCIIHYLINYHHYTEKKPERRGHKALLRAAHVFLPATKGHHQGTQKPSSVLSPCS